MARRKLEEIVFKGGRFVRLSDGREIEYPKPLGNPILDVVPESFASRYRAARDGAKEQGLWEIVNAYSIVVKNIRGVEFHETVAIQLYMI